MKTSIKTSFQLLLVSLTVALLCWVSPDLPGLAASGHSSRYAAKRVGVKPSTAHPTPKKAAQGAGVPYRTPEEMRELSDNLNNLDNSIALAKQGDTAAAQGDWKTAEGYYQQALDLWPDNSLALYGMGKLADNAGDTDRAISYYRTATYADNSPHTKYNTQTNDVTRLMEFVLLLNKAGQEQEALAVYHRAAHLLNYRDADSNGGKPYLKVLLPEFGVGPGQVAYTPQRLEAMARVAIAIESQAFDGKQALPQDREAIALYPDSPVAYYYLGVHLPPTKGLEAKAAYQKAAQLGDEQTRAAANERVKQLR